MRRNIELEATVVEKYAVLVAFLDERRGAGVVSGRPRNHELSR